jgi:hypothetical protein
VDREEKENKFMVLNHDHRYCKKITRGNLGMERRIQKRFGRG